MSGSQPPQAKSHSVEEIVALLGESVLEVAGPRSLRVRRPAPIGQADAESITFCSAKGISAAELIRKSEAGIIICEAGAFEKPARPAQALIATDQPRLAFIRVVQALFSEPPLTGIHKTAVVDEDAQIAEGVYVGPLASVGRNCSIGRGSVLHQGVHIYPGTQIGENVIVHSGTVVGADGFGYQRGDDGVFEKFPHLGGVIIENGVEIGANTCIDRGTLASTLIREGAKIDNLVHIAHNVIVGRHAAVIAHAMVGGGTTIGDFAWLAPCACIRDGITIGAHATIGLGAVVTKDVPEGVTVMGAPARDAAEYKAMLTSLKRLGSSG